MPSPRLGVALVATLLVSSGVLVGPTAHATESDVETFASLFGEHADAARASLLARAAAEGLDAEQVAQQALGEFEVAREDGAKLQGAGLPLEARPISPDPAADVEPPEAEVESVTIPASSGGDDGNNRVPIGAADYRGDIFYYPSSSWGINHGHVGIYRWRKVIVEAANADLGVRKVSAFSRKVPEGETYLFWVGPNDSSSYAKQRAAADWSNSTVGKDYRPWWHSSNKYHGAPWNCSQLLWSAFHRQSVYLDSNGGDWVYPADIVNSSRSHAYKKV